MSSKVDHYHYTFGEIILFGNKPRTSDKTTWYIECPECNGRHQFRKLGRKIWVAHCILYDLEWTITPREYYVKKPTDFTRIMGRE